MPGLLTIGVFLSLASYGAVGLLRRWSERRQILDIPNERSSHIRPIPRGGGLAIVLITLLAWAGYGIFQSNPPVWWLAWTGGLLVAVIGWFDDLYNLSSKLRFGVHAISAILAIIALGYWSVITLVPVGTIHLGWVGYLVTFLWVVGLINAYNFMDGIDGMAGGQAVIAGVGWVVIGWHVEIVLVALLGIVLTASSLGFLGHNWSPAKIFMGDVASGFLGYMFAVIPLLLLDNSSPSGYGLLIAALLLWPFLFDTILTFLRRAYRRENVFAAHRSHLYQRLVITGFSHHFVTSLYVALACVGLLIGLFVHWQWVYVLWGIGIVIVCSIFLLAFVAIQEQDI
jgi:Fuc2NAc and GlcNAc transferase